jgi:hypothetical protein
MDGTNSVKYILENKIEGSFVECGVDSGNFQVLWIEELKKQNQIRNIYLYDTFTGLTEPSEFDYTRPDAVYYNMDSNSVKKTWESQIIDSKTNRWCYTPLDKVKLRLKLLDYPSENLHYIVGDVMETLKMYVPEKIAILRLDTDWYESSKFELEMMYDSVVSRGLVIFDDYYHWDGQRRAVDDFFEKRNEKVNIIKLDGKTGVMIKNYI